MALESANYLDLFSYQHRFYNQKCMCACSFLCYFVSSFVWVFFSHSDFLFEVLLLDVPKENSSRTGSSNKSS